MSRSQSRTYFVAKNATGSWTVTRSGASSKVFETKDAAVKAARQIVRQDGGVLEIKNSDGRTQKSFTLGRAAMTKLNEVEGVTLSGAGKRTFKEFDRKGLTPSERRAKLRKDPTKLTAGVRSPQSPRSSQSERTKV
ncbi:DUF2188 domain-containing protein [Phenylobacterium kunshanense]|uniref:DUF2188 domain-containing protein n=1 Tax=Phenylobacterium kunshanense TaxID=1445034 RepID=A0A328BMW8_9CAUL|nr:DUF2188 domain-containing protein [Phenylobacterium kunshanense]RAK66358.1 hypothetical protein DJ019_08910 [Phenylobacterium kunshanense]